MNNKKGTVKRICELLFSGVLIALVLIFLLWFLYYFKVFNMPSFINDFFGGKQESVDSSYYNEDDFYSYLSSKNEPVIYSEELELTEDNVREFVDALVLTDNYYWELELSFFYGDETKTYTHKSWSHGGKMRVDSSSLFEDTSTVFDGKTVFLRNNVSGEKTSFEAENTFAVDNLVNISDIRFYLDSEMSRVSSAEMINTDEGKYLQVVFYTEALDKTDEFFISLGDGVVLFVNSKISDTVVFQQKTKDFYLLTNLPDSYFKI